MTVWILHSLIPFLVLLFMAGGPCRLTLIIPPLLLAFLMGALVWFGYWVTAVPTLAGSVLFMIVLPWSWFQFRDWRELRHPDDSMDDASAAEK